MKGCLGPMAPRHKVREGALKKKLNKDRKDRNKGKEESNVRGRWGGKKEMEGGPY